MPILGSTGGLSARAFGFRGLTAAPFILQGNYDALATVTVPNGGVSSITFAGIPQTGYSHLQLRILQRASGSGSNWTNQLQFNGDTTSANYREHFLYGDGSSVGAGSYQQWYIAQGSIPGAGNSANIFGVAVIDILDYANTNKNKVVKSLSGFDANGSGEVMFDSLLWMNTNTITSITMTVYTTNLTEYSQFALYGVKA
jgi:hypothetical protein